MMVAKRAYTHAVCNRTLSCSVILNALLHTAQVYVYVCLTKEKNLTSNPNFHMDCHPSRTPTLKYAHIICSMEVVCTVKNQKGVSTAAAAASTI
jgi:hypothetical protein